MVLEREGLDHGTKGVGVNHSAAHYCSKSGFSERGGNKWKPHRKRPIIQSDTRALQAPDIRGCGGILFYTSSFRSAESCGVLVEEATAATDIARWPTHIWFGSKAFGTIPTFYAQLTFFQVQSYANFCRLKYYAKRKTNYQDGKYLLLFPCPPSQKSGSLLLLQYFSIWINWIFPKGLQLNF